jgi:hypothetical protein
MSLVLQEQQQTDRFRLTPVESKSLDELLEQEMRAGKEQLMMREEGDRTRSTRVVAGTDPVAAATGQSRWAAPAGYVPRKHAIQHRDDPAASSVSSLHRGHHQATSPRASSVIPVLVRLCWFVYVLVLVSSAGRDDTKHWTAALDEYMPGMQAQARNNIVPTAKSQEKVEEVAVEECASNIVPAAITAKLLITHKHSND